MVSSGDRRRTSRECSLLPLPPRTFGVLDRAGPRDVTFDLIGELRLVGHAGSDRRDGQAQVGRHGGNRIGSILSPDLCDHLSDQESSPHQAGFAATRSADPEPDEGVVFGSQGLPKESIRERVA